MASQHIKMEVTHIGMIDGVEVCYSGKKRARISGQRMYGQSVKDQNATLSRSQLI